MPLTPQQGKINRYFRVLSDKDLSGDVFEFSLDEVSWFTGTYVPVGSLPPRPAAIHTANPAPTGYTGYWWSVLTGPGTSLLLNRGPAKIFGRATDSPELPHFGWSFQVGWSD
jgi:hypothetical protein